MSNFLGKLLSISISISVLTCPVAFGQWKRPKLVVAIVIDQFRADYLLRFQSRFLPAQKGNTQVGGFQYLMSKGAYYPFGQYDVAQSITAPGHAAILSGAYPYLSGIPLNSWFNEVKKERVYCVADPKTQLVGSSPVDSPGFSPSFFQASTVGDELKNAGFPSKVVSIALKDRASVLLGGHRADLSLWFDTQSKQWVSSTFYLPNKNLPDWVNEYNKELPKRLNHVLTWKEEGPETGYSTSQATAIQSHRESIGYREERFPHQLILEGDTIFASPFGIEMTEELAEKAIDQLKLGKSKTTDLLAVSFSSHDYLGHAYGPNSREMEEITIVEDRAISKLLNTIQKKVPGGLSEVVVLLTADHGVAPHTEWLASNGIAAKRFDQSEIKKQLGEYLEDQIGKLNAEEWVLHVENFHIYLNRPLIEKKDLSMERVEAEAKKYLKKFTEFEFIFTSSEYEQRKFPPGIFEKQLQHSYYPGRSGDIVLIAKPYVIPSGKKGPTATHVSGYSYDRTVPIILSGFGIHSGVYSTRAEVVDIAPTLSFLMGVLPPSSSQGRVLSEILK